MAKARNYTEIKPCRYCGYMCANNIMKRHESACRKVPAGDELWELFDNHPRLTITRLALELRVNPQVIVRKLEFAGYNPDALRRRNRKPGLTLDVSSQFTDPKARYKNKAKCDVCGIYHPSANKGKVCDDCHHIYMSMCARGDVAHTWRKHMKRLARGCKARGVDVPQLRKEVRYA